MNVRGARLKTALAILGLAAGFAIVAGTLASGALTPASISGPLPLPSTAAGLSSSAPSTTPSALQGAASVTPTSAASANPALPSPTPSPSIGPVVATRIVIADLGINLPIYTGDGVTVKVGYVAQYPTTSWPGGGTLIYLYGHARDKNFIRLWDAKVGQRIQMVLEDGRTAVYQIVKIRPRVAWNDLSMLDPTPTEILRLQTCNSYQDTAPRFIVDAVPVPAD